MKASIQLAKRLIEALLALMAGHRVPVDWTANCAGIHAPTGRIKLPHPRVGDADEVALLTRLAVHEAGHLKKTDPGWAERLAGDEEKQFFNALEDPRMEREQCAEYPGASLILRRGLGGMMRAIADADVLYQDTGKALTIDLLVRAFMRVQPHEEIKAHADVILGKAAANITPEQREALDRALDAIALATNSRDAEVIASTLAAQLYSTPPAPPDEPNGPQADGNSQGEESPEQEGNNPAEAQEPPASDDGEADPEQPAGSAGDNGDGDDAGDASNDKPGAEGDPDQGDHSPNDGAGDQDPQPGVDEHNQASGDDAPTSAGDQGQGSAEQACADEPIHEAGSAQGDSESPSAEGPASDEPTTGNAEQQLPSSSADPIDLGSLLRQVHLETYGQTGEDATEPEGAPELSDQEIERVAQVVSREDFTGDMQELFEQVLASLAPSSSNQPSDDDRHGCDATLSLAGSGELQTIRPMDWRANLQGVQSRLVVVLQRELQERKRRPTKPAIAGGRLLTHRYWRFGALADTKVFAKTHVVSGVEAAATILLDRSDSMDGRMTVAVDAALAFSMALQRLRVATRFVVYPGSEPLVQEVQRFGEPARSAQQRASGIFARGGTPTGAAVLAELPELMRQRKLKKFVVIITDGRAADRLVLLNAIAYAQSMDIQVLGIGIGVDIADTIRESVPINTVEELPQALAELFRRDMLTQLAA